jgi:hypothetical protein
MMAEGEDATLKIRHYKGVATADGQKQTKRDPSLHMPSRSQEANGEEEASACSVQDDGVFFARSLTARLKSGPPEERSGSCVKAERRRHGSEATVEPAPVARRATSAGSTDPNIEEKANAKV